MTTANQEFRRYMRAVKPDMEDKPGGHPSVEDLFAYRGGAMTKEGRERVQAHLVQCAECIEVLKDVDDFVDPESAAGEAAAPVDLDRKWEGLWPRVEEAERETAPSSPAPRWARRRSVLPLAAALVLAWGLTLAWALWLQRENQRLAGLTDPGFNAPILDLYPLGSISRSEAESLETRIAVPESAHGLVLLLHGHLERDYADYGMEIIASQGDAVWRGTGLKPNQDGAFMVTIDRSFLEKRSYRLRLFGQEHATNHMIAEYLISIE